MNFTRFKNLCSLFLIAIISIMLNPCLSYGETNTLNRHVRNSHEFPQAANKILKLLMYIQNIKLEKTTPLHREFFGYGNDGSIYLKLFDEFSGFSPGYRSDPTILAYASQNFPIVIINKSTLEIDDLPFTISVIIHEALHFKNEKRVRPHSFCPEFGLDSIAITSNITGESFKDIAACDSIYNGTYGAQAVMLNNLARFCINCSENERQLFSYYADYFKRRIIDSESFNVISKDFRNVGQ